MSLPARQAAKGELMARPEITIRPETPISSTWRLVHVGDRRGRWLSKRGRVYGGTMRQAHEAAIHVAEENGFVYVPPEGMALPPGPTTSGAALILPPGAARDS